MMRQSNIPAGAVRVMPVADAARPLSAAAPVRNQTSAINTPIVTPQTTASMQMKFANASAAPTVQQPRPLPAIPTKTTTDLQKPVLAAQIVPVSKPVPAPQIEASNPQRVEPEAPQIITAPQKPAADIAKPTLKPQLGPLEKYTYITPELRFDINCEKKPKASKDKRPEPLKDKDKLKKFTATFTKHVGVQELIAEAVSSGPIVIKFKSQKEIGSSASWSVSERLIRIDREIEKQAELMNVLVFELCNAANKGINQLHNNCLAYNDSFAFAFENEKEEFHTQHRHKLLMREGVLTYKWKPSVNRCNKTFNIKNYQIPSEIYNWLTHQQVVAKFHNTKMLRIATESEKLTEGSDKVYWAAEASRRALIDEKIKFYATANKAETYGYKESLARAINEYNEKHLLFTKREASIGDKTTDIEQHFIDSVGALKSTLKIKL